jgi:GGDEF domain-containing protein
MHTHPTTTCPNCQSLEQRLQAALWSPMLNMPNQAGLFDKIAQLDPSITYTVVFIDIDYLKRINTVTGGHFSTNRYLADGLKVRAGEFIAQFLGDEFVALMGDRHYPPHAKERRHTHVPDVFVARIARQLAGQPLTISERYALAAAQGVPVEQARLSAAFATASGVSAGQVIRTIEQLSRDVLQLKAQRD